MATPPAEKPPPDALATRRALLEEATRCLSESGVDVAHAGARREAEWMLADVLPGTAGRAGLHARIGQRVAAEAAERFRALVCRRAGGEPLAYVLGHADFFGLRLRVSPDVLIPRPETETVVEVALRRLHGVQQPNILDAGTGSGCIALALKNERPDAAVYACDVSRDALAVARRNAGACGLEVPLFEADVLAEGFPETAPAGLDLLVSNPPYVPEAERAALPEAVRGHEPGVALFSGADPLRFYHALAGHATALLAPGGSLVLEAHADHAAAVAALLREHGLEGVAVERDAFGKERIVAGQHPACGA